MVPPHFTVVSTQPNPGVLESQCKPHFFACLADQQHHQDVQKKVGCRHRISVSTKRVLVYFGGFLALSAQLEGQCETDPCRMSSRHWKSAFSDASKTRHAESMAPKNPVVVTSILWFVTPNIFSYSTPKWLWMLLQQYFFLLFPGAYEKDADHIHARCLCLLSLNDQQPIHTWINSEWPLAWSRRRPTAETIIEQKFSLEAQTEDAHYTLRLGREEGKGWLLLHSSYLPDKQHGTNSPSHISMHFSMAIFPLLIHNSLLSLLDLFSLWLRWTISCTPSNKPIHLTADKS